MPIKDKSSVAKAGWKDVQSKKKKSRMIKLALAALVLVVGLIVTSWMFRFTQSLFSPWKLQTSQHAGYIWNAQFNINLLIRGKRISLLSYNPKQEKIVIINLPDETFLEVPGGFGFWQLRAVYELGGDKLLTDSLSIFLGAPIDGFLDLSALTPQKTAIELVDTIRKNPFSGLNFLSALKTNLTAWELLRLTSSMLSVRFDKVKEVNLDKLNVLDREKLPDGTEVLKADPVKLDSSLTDLADPAIVSEHKSIAVLNATGKPQLAQKAARLITNLGGNVIITANASQRLKNTQLQGLPSATLKRLRQIFITSDKISSSQDAVEFSRAEINLLLGEDYVKD